MGHTTTDPKACTTTTGVTHEKPTDIGQKVRHQHQQQGRRRPQRRRGDQPRERAIDGATDQRAFLKFLSPGLLTPISVPLAVPSFGCT